MSELMETVKRLIKRTEDAGKAMEEAAAEIERLREENIRLRKSETTWIICAERLVESLDGIAYVKALDFYADCQRLANKAVQGE